MRRIRITGRFYVFIALVLVGLYFIFQPFGGFDSSEAVVTPGYSSYGKTVDAVIVRDESVSSFEGSGMIAYLAEEGAAVNQGQEIADVYTTRNAEKELRNLEEVRKNIRAYYQTVLSTIKDENLTRLENNVQAQALELRRLIQSNATGSLLNVEKALEQTMQERQAYLRNNQRQDPKLNNLYEAESKSKTALEAWKTTFKADRDGIVSFYMDGYETALAPDALEEFTAADARRVLNKEPLPQTAKTRLRQNIFKVVKNDRWYVLLLTSDTSWNPISGQTFQMQMEGVSNFGFVGTVVGLQKSGNDVLAQVQVDGELGPLINRRSGKMDIGVNLTGLKVPLAAITTENGQTGVIVNDISGISSFVPVEVLHSDSRSAIVEPLVDGTLELGQRVKLR